MSRPEKDPAFVAREERPFNGGPPPASLPRAFLTPRALFFVRSHGDVPRVDPAAYALAVTGLVRTPTRLSPADLRARFPRRSLVATLQCAGNRRDELLALGPIPGELAWGADAIGNAEWAGVALADVLAAAGIAEGARHVAFAGLDAIAHDGTAAVYGGSIPLEMALAGDVLLADEMNGEPLAPEHGHPLRVVVPGYIGARSVKWLAEVRVQAAPSDNYYQAHAYRRFPPEATAETADWACAEALGECPLTSVICSIEREGEAALVARGYAYGGACPAARVEVSLDGAAPWIEATLVPAPERARWAWRLWEARLPRRPGARAVVARAWDAEGRGQPETLASVWNFKGYLNTAWHRVPLDERGG